MTTPQAPYDPKARHTAAEYKEALKACRPLLRDTKYLDMLKANYYAPHHKITASEMAEAVDYANWNAANLHYGTFAGAVAEELGHTRGKLEGKAVEVTPDVAILVSFSGGGCTGEHVGWQLLPSVVQALEEMGWVKRDAAK